jgi:magnesium chelatase accessory protein
MTRRLLWERDGRDWPNRAASRFVLAGGLDWHVQVMGEGPVLVLLHGTGAATHSWRGLLPLLARRFTVIAPDLPGHGFTGAPPREGMSLPAMARSVAALLLALDVRPALVVGHSAGAAILVRMCLDGLIAPAAVISLNGALVPLPAMPEELFGPVARVMTAFAFVPRLFAWQASHPRALRRLVDSTGSTLDAAGVALYRKLASNPGHVAAALGMMANWGLKALERDLPRLAVPLTLVTSAGDRTVPPGEALRVRQLLPQARLVSVPLLGHLAHEEDPAGFAAIITDVALRAGILAAA